MIISAEFPRVMMMYLARLLTEEIVSPLTEAIAFGVGIGKRSFFLPKETLTSRCPSRWGASPRHITSTSGSSGICDPHYHYTKGKISLGFAVRDDGRLARPCPVIGLVISNKERDLFLNISPNVEIAPLMGY
jgi:hypothetical protein